MYSKVFVILSVKTSNRFSKEFVIFTIDVFLWKSSMYANPYIPFAYGYFHMGISDIFTGLWWPSSQVETEA